MSTHRDQHELDSDTVNQAGSSPRPEIKEKGSNYKSVMTSGRPMQTEAHLKPGSPQGVKVSPQSLSHLKKHMQVPDESIRFDVKKAKDFPSYPLERPIRTNKTVPQVAKIIDDLMKDRSVEVTFNSDEARAICVTDDFLKYYVNLYSSTDGCTLVEVQRRKGCSLSFRKERMALVNALEGKPQQSQSQPVLRIPPELIEDMGGYPTLDEIKAIINNCIDQLHNSNGDGKLIAFQHLSSMTNPSKSNADSALKAALIIMDPQSGYDHAIMGAIAVGKGNVDEFCILISNACLTIFANCLESLSQNADDYNRLFNSGDWVVTQLLPRLIITIQKSHSLHNSCVAMRCLCTLLKNSPNVREAVESSAESKAVLANALSVGKASHANLEKIATGVTGLIGSLA